MARGLGSITVTAAGGTRTWTVEDTTASGLPGRLEDAPAGHYRELVITVSTTGLTPPPNATVTLTWKDANGTQHGTVDSFSTTTSRGSGYGFRADPFNSGDFLGGGTARAGVLEIDLRVNTNGGIGGYNVSTDGRGTQDGGGTVTRDRYVQRATTTRVVRVGRGNSLDPVSLFAYPDDWRVRWEFEHAVFALTGSTVVRRSPGGTLVTNTSMTAPSGATQSQAAFVAVVANGLNGTDRFTPNYTFTADPVLTLAPAFTSTTFAGLADVDPRLTPTRLMQHNDNAFGTPPLSKDAGVQRLTSDLSFLSTRLTNARGEGVNGVSVSRSLRDAGNLVPAQTQASESTTNVGGEAGWLPTLIPWSSALPTGTWRVTHTASGNASGLIIPTTTDHALVAADPNLVCVVAGGPGSPVTDSRHFTPGEPFVAGLAVFHSGRDELVEVDPDAAWVMLSRFNLATGQAECLQVDGVTWLPAQVPGNVVYHPAAETFPGSKAYVVGFAPEQTATWNASDVFTIGKAEVGGVPVANYLKEIAVGGVNNHTSYAFDGAGFLGFPSK